MVVYCRTFVPYCTIFSKGYLVVTRFKLVKVSYLLLKFEADLPLVISARLNVLGLHDDLSDEIDVLLKLPFSEVSEVNEFLPRLFD